MAAAARDRPRREILALNVDDLDQPNKRARMISKSGATDWVF